MNCNESRFQALAPELKHAYKQFILEAMWKVTNPAIRQVIAEDLRFLCSDDELVLLFLENSCELR